MVNSLKNNIDIQVHMGGRISKARRACMTSKTTSVNASATGGGLDVSKNYDTTCVSNMLASK